MVRLGMTEGGNIQQRVFDAFPPYPQGVTVFELYKALPAFHQRSVQSALFRLHELGKVEAVPGTRFHYRIKRNATRPADGRFDNHNAAGSHRK
jgi:hypothetical protein